MRALLKRRVKRQRVRRSAGDEKPMCLVDFRGLPGRNISYGFLICIKGGKVCCWPGCGGLFCPKSNKRYQEGEDVFFWNRRRMGRNAANARNAVRTSPAMAQAKTGYQLWLA